MDLIYNGNHILRKSFNLSLNEWAVLCDIKDMSQNQKYNYWCIKSKSRIADWLDLSERTVFNAIETLFLKNLIQKNELGYLKISQMLMDMCSTQDGIGIYIKGDDFELISARVKSYVEGYAKNAEGMQKMQSTYAKNAEQPMQNLHTSINISNTKSNNILGDSKFSFEQFWDLYNKKVGDKKKCVAKWNKLTEEQKEKIMQTLPTFLSTIKDKQFQPYPERYLNNERWNDDLSQQIKFDPTDPTKTKRVYN